MPPKRRRAARKSTVHTERLQFDRSSACFRLDNLVCKGLTKHLQTTFWPNYKYSVATASHAHRKGSGNGKGPRAGKRRGTTVDRQVTRIINQLTDERIKLSVFVRQIKKHNASRKTRTAVHPLPATWSVSLQHYASNLHYCTVMALATLDRMQLEPVQAQLPVCHATSRIATAVDIVCKRRSNGDTVLVELKCGFEGYATAASGKMRAPFQAFDNHPQNQHAVQLLLTKHLFCNWTNDRSPEACVLTVTSQGSSVRWLDKAIEDKRTAAWRRLKQRVTGRVKLTARKPRGKNK